jgi:hypothetical protein
LPEAEAFASDLCYAGLAVSLPGYGATEVPPGLDPEITLNVILDAVSHVKKLPWIDSKQILPLRFLPWRVLRLAAGQPDRGNQRVSLAVRSL